MLAPRNLPRLLEPSTEPGATTETQGMDPRAVDPGLLRDLGHIDSPIAAIRAFCIDCAGGSFAEARRCTAARCQLWPFRMGVNVFHAKAGRRGGEVA